jgi:Tfp pilus assembly protein PilF
MKTIIGLICLILLGSCVTDEKNKITNTNDYEQFLSSEPVQFGSKYFKLWNSKIKPDSMQLTSLGISGGEYTRYFNQTGDIAYLKKAEQALKRAVDIAAIGKSDYYRALARNYISQHRFKGALYWAEKAHKLGSGLEDSKALLFDVHMELGNYEIAESFLDEIRNDANFGYLIRAAKWSDYKGNLDAAIVYMERAKLKANNGTNDALKLWAYTNLADFYGHAGRVEEAYRHYLKALAIDGNNAYAKKGIAWIVFSHEKNAQEALRIMEKVTEYNQTPDYQMLKAEIASFLNEPKKTNAYLDAYYNRVKNKAYGSMYNTYTIKFYLEETKQYDKAIALALQEVNNRATPESYDLLAYSYFKNNEIEKAFDVMKNFVEGKTYEPEALYHMAVIYKVTGAKERVEILKRELQDASFEMGPSFPQLLTML